MRKNLKNVSDWCSFMLFLICAYVSFIYCAAVRGLRPANGILLHLWTLQHLLMQWSRSIWRMLVIWYLPQCSIFSSRFKLRHYSSWSFCSSINTCFLQELVARNIESSDLNFTRYGDTFFEVSFLISVWKYQVLMFFLLTENNWLFSAIPLDL